VAVEAAIEAAVGELLLLFFKGYVPESTPAIWEASTANLSSWFWCWETETLVVVGVPGCGCCRWLNVDLAGVVIVIKPPPPPPPVFVFAVRAEVLLLL
jgi:hypothetical protein